MKADTADTGAGKRSLQGWLLGQMRNIAPFATLIFLVVFFSAASPSFLTVDNAAIAAFIKASTNKITHQCDASIPGIEIYPDDQARVS